MSFMDLSTWFKTNYRQSQGQIWVMGIVGIGLLLVTTIAYQIYDSAVLFSSLRSGDQELNALPGQAEQSPVTQIAQTPLFGTSAQSKVSQVNTNLELFGVLLASDKSQARAIIASLGKEPKVYSINQALADGGKLYRVYPNKVELQRNGQIESLYLKWDKRSATADSHKITKTTPAAEYSSEDDSSADQSFNTPAAEAVVNQPPTSTSTQTPEDWQARIKEIREKYQQQFGDQNNPNVNSAPLMPMKGRGRFGGGL
jgi:type II secretory pathway component PulC